MMIQPGMSSPSQGISQGSETLKSFHFASPGVAPISSSSLSVSSDRLASLHDAFVQVDSGHCVHRRVQHPKKTMPTSEGGAYVEMREFSEDDIRHWQGRGSRAAQENMCAGRHLFFID